jgi:hypothetical protein
MTRLATLGDRMARRRRAACRRRTLESHRPRPDRRWCTLRSPLPAHAHSGADVDAIADLGPDEPRVTASWCHEIILQ